jgi:hypothetical protein
MYAEKEVVRNHCSNYCDDFWVTLPSLLKVYENRMLMRVFGPKRKYLDSGENC